MCISGQDCAHARARRYVPRQPVDEQQRKLFEIAIALRNSIALSPANIITAFPWFRDRGNGIGNSSSRTTACLRFLRRVWGSRGWRRSSHAIVSRISLCDLRLRCFECRINRGRWFHARKWMKMVEGDFLCETLTRRKLILKIHKSCRYYWSNNTSPLREPLWIDMNNAGCQGLEYFMITSFNSVTWKSVRNVI